MSKSPEDDTASQATERGKTRASQTLGETDGGQEQVEERQKQAVEESGGEGGGGGGGNPTHKRKHNTMPPDNKSIMGTIKGY